MARRAVAPVPSALERSTDMVPRTTQNPCRHVRHLDHRDREGQPDGTTQRVAEPHRTKGQMGEEPVGEGCGAEVPIAPDRRSTTCFDPAASSAASATISVAMPRARAWNPGSSDPAMPSSATGDPATGPPAERGIRDGFAHGGHVGTERGVDQRVERAGGVLDRRDPFRIVDRVARPSQIRAAVRCRVSATCSVIARAGLRSTDQCWSPTMAVLPATHSTRPTSLESATAPPAAPVGGYGVPVNCRRRRASSR